ncbi:hypothetical protein [Marmot herpesvirus 1]|nr:hypothetical protein [Marmot herpesvirus 1]
MRIETSIVPNTVPRERTLLNIEHISFKPLPIVVQSQVTHFREHLKVCLVPTSRKCYSPVATENSVRRNTNTKVS